MDNKRLNESSDDPRSPPEEDATFTEGQQDAPQQAQYGISHNDVQVHVGDIHNATNEMPTNVANCDISNSSIENLHVGDVHNHVYISIDTENKSPAGLRVASSTEKDDQSDSAITELSSKLQGCLKRQALIAIGETNMPIKLDKTIDVVPLEISESYQEQPENLDEEGHYIRRTDFFGMYETKQGDVKLSEIFQKAKEKAEEAAEKKTKNATARLEHISIHGNIVGIVGQAGIGKTTLTKSLAKCIVEKDLHKEIEYIFYIPFRNIDFETKTGFLQFLVTSSGVSDWEHDENSDKSLLKELDRHHDRVILILDGLDEASEHITLPKRAGLTGLHSKKIKAEIFVKNILSGKILTRAKKFITSRPRQLYALHKDHRPHFIVNVLGLSTESQEKLCKNICDDMYDEVMDYLNRHPDISAYCYVPVNCILTMYCIHQSLTNDNKANLKSVTGIMSFALKNYMQSEHIRGKGNIAKLVHLAWKGIREKKIIFTEEDLQADDVQIDQDELSDFLQTYIDEKHNIKILEGKKRSYFSHLVWQEFFAAIELMLYMGYKNFESHIAQFEDSRFEVIVKLMFGLCNRDTLKQLKGMSFPNCDHQKKADRLKEFAREKAPSKVTDSTTTEELFRVCDWLKEANNDDITDVVASKLTEHVELKGTIFPSDVANFHHFLRTAKTSFEVDVGPRINLVGDSCERFFVEMQETIKESQSKVKNIRIEGRDEMSDNALEAMCKCLKDVEELTLWSCKLTSKQAIRIPPHLENLDNPLKKLNLSDNEIEDDGVHSISACLSNIKKLHIDDCKITEIGMEYLSMNIKNLETPMEELRLPGNNIGNKGAEFLASCLHNIQSLNIQKCGITFSGMQKILAEIAKRKEPLKEIHLRDNGIEDRGAECLAKCINKIQVLAIQKCGITEKGIEVIAAAIQALPQPLLRLDIDGNKIGDRGAIALSKCLNNIRHLQLVGCSIKKSGKKALQNALSSLPEPKPKIGGLKEQDMQM